MTRAVFAALFLAVVPVLRAAPAGIPFDDPAHPHFFKYQAFLATKGLHGETKETWDKLPEGDRARELQEGEDFLKKKFQQLMADPHWSDEDKALLEAVWGHDISEAVKKVGDARKINDPKQIDAAIENVNALSKKVGNLGVDWPAIFDGKKPGEVLDPYAEYATKDLLEVKPKSGFLESLRAPEVREALATQKSFVRFLQQHQVPSEALPGMTAMYTVLTRAQEPEKAEIAHLLPTVVKFLVDGKKIVLEDMRGALGYAVPGPYDKPEKVGITHAVRDADPLVVGKTLSHEFQHIYDMYTGRYYTMDSELRGFKTAVLYFRALKKDNPKKYQELSNSDDDTTRGILKDAEEYSKSYDKGQVAFYDAVAVGHYYTQWEEGVFFGRVPLRESVNQKHGAPRELRAIRGLRDNAGAQVEALEKRQAEIRKQREQKPSRELDKELEKVAKDLSGARSRLDHLDREATLKEIRIHRMQSEVDWLNKKSRGQREPPPFDLHLPVDEDYVAP